MANDLVLNVRDFGAVGDRVTDDTAAIRSAAASATSSRRDVYFPAGTYNITETVTSTARFTFAEGAMIHSSNFSVLELKQGYSAGLCQVFTEELEVRIQSWRMDVLYFEHFGARVLQDANGLSDPINGTNDSTAAIQKLFKSLQGRIWPPQLAAQPGTLNSFTVRLLGIYGISDEIKVNPGGYQICGSGGALFGTGFKWVGPEEIPPRREEGEPLVHVGNGTKAMLRLFGPQWAEVDGLIFIGLPTAYEETRLYAGVLLQSGDVNPELPFPKGEFGRRTTIRRCQFGDVGLNFEFGSNAPYQFQHGIITDGENGNDDFHLFENCVVVGAEHGITIGNSQNVDIQIRNCGVAYARTAGVWQRNGGELLIDGLYFYHMEAVGSSFLKVGDEKGTQGAPSSRITMRLIGGELNPGITSFVHVEHSPGGAALFWDLTRCEIALPGHGKRPGRETLFLSGSRCSYSMIFDNCDISGRFALTGNKPPDEFGVVEPHQPEPRDPKLFRNMITFRGCRNLELVMVQNSTCFSQSVLDVEVQNCWAQSFQAGPRRLETPPEKSNLAQRFVGGISYKKRFSHLNARVPIALDDPALYATTSTLSDKVGIGNAGFGFESELGYKTFLSGTRNQFTLRFRGMIPARSVVFGCQIGCIESNLLANSNSLAKVYVGDDEDYKRYGSLPAQNGFTAGSVTDRFTPFVTAAARDVVLRGVWEIAGVKWTWNERKVTNSNSGSLTAAMVGNRLRFTTGPLAGTETTIVEYKGGVFMVEDSRSGSGEAVMFIRFAPGKRLLIAPAYFQMMSNSQTLADDFFNNLLYAEEIVPV